MTQVGTEATDDLTISPLLQCAEHWDCSHPAHTGRVTIVAGIHIHRAVYGEEVRVQRYLSTRLIPNIIAIVVDSHSVLVSRSQSPHH